MSVQDNVCLDSLMVSYDFCVVLYDTGNRLLVSIHTSHILSVCFCLLAYKALEMCSHSCALVDVFVNFEVKFHFYLERDNILVSCSE